METKLKRYTTSTVEHRAEGVDGGKDYITGRAIVYGSPYPMWDGCYEYIEKGALSDTDMSDVVATFNHEDELLLGRSVNGEGTLKLMADDEGLIFEVEANETTASRDCLTNVKLKNIRGCSFEFSVGEEDWAYEVPQADGTTATVRTIKKIAKLYAVNPVVYPAYRDTEIESMKRSAESNRPKPIEPNLEEQILTLKIKNR